MATKTKARKEYDSAMSRDQELLDRLDGIIAQDVPPYVTVKAIASANVIIERLERRRSEWFAREAEKAAVMPYYNVLPDNGRGGPYPRG
jgi:hypothetical protein